MPEKVPLHKRKGWCAKCEHELAKHHPSLSPGYYVCIGTTKPRINVVYCQCTIKDDEQGTSNLSP